LIVNEKINGCLWAYDLLSYFYAKQIRGGRRLPRIKPQTRKVKKSTHLMRQKTSWAVVSRLINVAVECNCCAFAGNSV